jgi:4-alpha-glucanotransferase
VSVDAWGISDGYHDIFGEWRVTSPATRAAIMAAMGAAPDASPPASGILVAREGQHVTLPGPGELRLEDGAVIPVGDALPPDIPLGYHQLHHAGEEPLPVVVAPARCHLPERLRAWGWAAQLYAARSAESWGIGDLADLARLGRWSTTELGAAFVLVNPLFASTPVPPQESSPYLPSTRRFFNPLYIRVEAVPGAADGDADLEQLATAGRALNHERRIDRDAVLRLKLAALQGMWGRGHAHPGFARHRAEQGVSLERFATYCALAEVHGRDWRGWPAEYRHPDGPAVARFATDHGDRVGFHAWLQWLLDRQLADAGREIHVLHDLPIGVDAGGVDAWEWQDVLGIGASVGAPPDRFTTRGQDWGIPPFIPTRLRAARYAPFVQTIRAALRHGRGLRIDHVMGLFRLFWIPHGLSPADGTYVRYPADDLLGLLALESHRARAIIVGEDLGTVEAGVRERLAAERVLSYRLLWFEPGEPATFPELALAAVNTHDLPTVAGLWSGADLETQRALGLAPNEAFQAALRERVVRLTGLDESAEPAQAVERLHAAMARAPSMLVSATLDDALAVVERPNFPSTVYEWPNWSLALPRDLDGLEQSALPRALARVLRDR